jgi:alcohol dehydrogenase class IV
MTVVWNFPTRIVFGVGGTAATGGEVARLGGTRALIVSDAGVLDAGLVEDIEKSLRRKKIPFEVYSEVSSNPTEKEVLAATAAYRRAKADSIVAVGGGSPIDVAKLVRLLVTHRPPLEQYAAESGGEEKVTEPMPPMAALPTTAGTGTEVARSAMAALERTKRKMVVSASRLIPDVAVLDPELTATMPADVTAATGFDALAHCIEAYCAKGDHPMADAIALEGIRHTHESLQRAVTDGEDMDARSGMMKAAMMGAVALQKGLGACHSLAYPLAADAGLHHGLANALCLPAVLDFNRSIVPDRIARIARIMGVRGDDLETLAFECSGAVRALRKKVLLPKGMSDAGVAADQLPELAKQAFAEQSHQHNPRECTEADMLALYKSSI